MSSNKPPTHTGMAGGAPSSRRGGGGGGAAHERLQTAPSHLADNCP